MMNGTDGLQAKKRGAPTQGKLAMQLDQQSRDGGRVVDAVREGKGREEAIVVSAVRQASEGTDVFAVRLRRRIVL